MTTFVLCYLIFIFFPVAGPYYMFPRPAAWFLDNPAARLVYDTLAEGSSYGAAFPSSHVAASLAATLSAGGLTESGARAAGAYAAAELEWSTARCITESMRWRVWWSGAMAVVIG